MKVKSKQRSKLPMTVLFFLRQLLWIVLLLTFLWQTHYSVDKYFEKGTSASFQRSNPPKLEFPAISFCPMRSYYDVMAEHLGTNGTEPKLVSFEEAMANKRKADTVIYFEPVGQEGMAFKLNSSSDDWTTTYTLSPYDLSILECSTYTASRLTPPGYTSSFKVYIKTKPREHTLVYVNKPGQNLLVPTRLYGRDFVKLPSLSEGNAGFIQYQVSITDHERLPESDMPCHKDDDDLSENILDCVNSHFEASRECSLPWRLKKDSDRRKCGTVDDLKSYQDRYMNFIHASEQDIFRQTGCYFTCKYRTYTLTPIISETDGALAAEAPSDLLVWLFLAPGGIVTEKEILVYDGYDLIGNIGGFLGLFLGASILSMYDNIRERIAKMKYFKN